MTGYQTVPKDELPEETKPTNGRETLLVRELVDGIRSRESARYLDLGYSDKGGFDGGLYLERIVFFENKAYLVTQGSGPCRPWTDEVVNFKAHLPLKTYVRPKRRVTLAEIADALERGASGGSDYVYLAVRKNFSPYGEHYVVPVASVGYHTLVNGAGEYLVDWQGLSLWAEVLS